MIKLGGVVKSYRTGDAEVRALGGVDLTIHDGGFVAIMGPSDVAHHLRWPSATRTRPIHAFLRGAAWAGSKRAELLQGLDDRVRATVRDPQIAHVHVSGSVNTAMFGTPKRWASMSTRTRAAWSPSSHSG